MPNPLAALLRSRKFWIAVFALIQSILFSLAPDFPAAVWQAIDGLAAVLIASIAVEDAAAKGARAVARLAVAMRRGQRPAETLR